MTKVSSRLSDVGEYYFATKLREIEALSKTGQPVINLGIGSPDLPPHPSVIETLQLEARFDSSHAYQPYKGSAILRNAIADWYKRYYHIHVQPDTEVLPLIGSKEGIMHICMTFLDKGDAALVPNPGYPTYTSAVKLSGGEVILFDLKEENSWHPDINQLTALIEANRQQGSQVKLLFLNYPHMPTGQLPENARLKKVIELAKQNDILVIHDNPYSFILNPKPASLLELDPKKETVIELNSLSKSHNMSGWRVGMLIASEHHINQVMRFKTNMDSGMFLPVQLAAAKALTLEQQWYDDVNEIYQQRKSDVLHLLDLLNCTYAANQVGMFVWARIPANFSSGFDFSDDVLRKSKVFITPGGIFGTAGDPFVRVSLCSKREVLQKAIDRIKNSDLIRNVK